MGRDGGRWEGDTVGRWKMMSGGVQAGKAKGRTSQDIFEMKFQCGWKDLNDNKSPGRWHKRVNRRLGLKGPIDHYFEF